MRKPFPIAIGICLILSAGAVSLVAQTPGRSYDDAAESYAKKLLEHHLDLGARPLEFRLLVREASNTGPHAIFSTVVDQATAYFYRA
jgi:hypothetical protein